ncbi:hypothetical protein F5879DRAFT_952184 [Lentinula edodes]|nr:hypothetical protein F5879DRAFT_952184 [Lentinula edodes]
MMSFQSIPFIQTKYLGNILEKARARMSNEKTLQHFSASSSHSLTRTGVGWIFEQNMHSRMCRSGGALRIYNASHHMLMHPPTHLLPGTRAGLKSPGVFDSFYWIFRLRTFQVSPAFLGIRLEISGCSTSSTTPSFHRPTGYQILSYSSHTLASTLHVMHRS